MNKLGHFAAVPTLTGSNYTSWQELPVIALKLSGLGKAITEDNVEENIGLQARLAVLGLMDELHRIQVRGCESVEAILELLSKVYADISVSNKFRLMLDFYRLKKESTDSIMEHIGKMS